MKKQTYYRERSRLKILFSSFCVGFVVLFSRLFYVQVVEGPYLTDIADKQYNVECKILPKRGRIYDRKGMEFASSVNVFSIYAVSKEINPSRKAVLTRQLASTLTLPEKMIQNRLQKNKSFVWIKRQVTEEEAEQVKALKDRHLQLIKEPKRFYPCGRLASQVIGFVDIDGNGLDGLELLYNFNLRGKEGKQCIQRDAKRRIVPALEYSFEPALDGHHLVVTLDQVIQHIAERELELVCKKYRANGGSVVVMDPFSGKIFAMANWPGYDLNTFAKASLEERRNRTITDCFEPGSTFKAITAAACLNEKVVKQEDTFFCEQGEYAIRGRILHDHKPHGTLTFREVIQYSSNIGVCKAAMKLGEKKLMQYIEAFGFGKKTQIDITGEVGGIVRPLSTWSRVEITSVPMGQGVAVTVLQMTAAYAVIANGGLLVKPLILEKIINQNGEIIKQQEPLIKRRVIREDTAALVRDFLTDVVDKGTGQSAAIEGIKVAGKTGTAQKLEPNGTYSHSKFVSSFFGFVPADKPRLVIGVVVDEPKGVYYGGVVAGPVFKRVAQDALKYLQIEESNKQ